MNVKSILIGIGITVLVLFFLSNYTSLFIETNYGSVPGWLP